MRKIIASEFYTLDGLMSDPKDEMEWVLNIFSKDVGKYEDDIYDQIDTLMLGRITYKIFEGYWPQALNNPATPEGEKEMAKKIDQAVKIVFSRSLKKVDWKNTKILNEINPAEIKKMKQQKGKHILLVGSAQIVQQFTDLDLIDEYHLLVHPVVLGIGKPLFANITSMRKLKLVKTRVFSNRVVGLFYEFNTQ